MFFNLFHSKKTTVPNILVFTSLLLLPGCLKTTYSSNIYAPKALDTQAIAFNGATEMPLTKANPQNEISQLSLRHHDNQTLAHATLGAILSKEKLEDLHLQVVSSNGTLLVVGEAPNQKALADILDTAETHPGVKDVYSHIEIRSNLSIETQLQDSTILKRVKHILSTIQPPQSHLQPIINNGRIFLLGYPDKINRDEFIKALSKIDNVTQIYLSP